MPGHLVGFFVVGETKKAAPKWDSLLGMPEQLRYVFCFLS
jgi:hypothetical protein